MANKTMNEHGLVLSAGKTSKHDFPEYSGIERNSCART